MPTTIHFPNGDTVNFPDGMSQDEIDKAAAAHYQEATGNVNPIPESSVMDKGLGVANTVLNTPGNTMDWLLDKVVGIKPGPSAEDVITAHQNGTSKPLSGDKVWGAGKQTAADLLKLAPFFVNPNGGFLKNLGVNTAVNAGSRLGSGLLEGESGKDALTHAGIAGGFSAAAESLFGGVGWLGRKGLEKFGPSLSKIPADVYQNALDNPALLNGKVAGVDDFEPIRDKFVDAFSKMSKDVRTKLESEIQALRGKGPIPPETKNDISKKIGEVIAENDLEGVQRIPQGDLNFLNKMKETLQGTPLESPVISKVKKFSKDPIDTYAATQGLKTQADDYVKWAMNPDRQPSTYGDASIKKVAAIMRDALGKESPALGKANKGVESFIEDISDVLGDNLVKNKGAKYLQDFSKLSMPEREALKKLGDGSGQDIMQLLQDQLTKQAFSKVKPNISLYHGGLLGGLGVLGHSLGIPFGVEALPLAATVLASSPAVNKMAIKGTNAVRNVYNKAPQVIPALLSNLLSRQSPIQIQDDGSQIPTSVYDDYIKQKARVGR